MNSVAVKVVPVVVEFQLLLAYNFSVSTRDAVLYNILYSGTLSVYQYYLHRSVMVVVV